MERYIPPSVDLREHFRDADFSPEWAVAELEQPISRIMESLRPDIEAGNFSIILGEDASGRVPALIFKEAINSIYKSKGFQSPKVLFVAGARNFVSFFEAFNKEPGWRERENSSRRQEKVEKLIYHFRDNAPEEGKKMLVVTDALESGRSLGVLCDALNEANINYEVAVVGADSSLYEDELIEFQKRFNQKLHLGQRVIPQIAQEPSWSGVSKEAADLHSKRYLYAKDWEKSQLGEVRKLAKECAGKVIENYYANNEQAI